MGKKLVNKIRIGLFISIFTSPVMAFTGTSELFRVPTALSPKLGETDFGFAYNYMNKGTAGVFEPELYLAHAFTDQVEYSIKVDTQLNTVHAIHSQLLAYYDEENEIWQYLAFGGKNLGPATYALPPNFPVLDYYLIYTLSPHKSQGFHVGVGRDRITNRFLLLAGLDVALQIGTVIVEFDGKLVNLGLKYNVENIYDMFFVLSPMKGPTAGETGLLLQVGFSFNINPLANMREDVALMKERHAKSIASFERRLSALEARDRALMETNSVKFLEELEDKFLDKRYITKATDSSSKSRLKGAVIHMQRGLENYYKNNFKTARDEYKIVTSLLPNLAIGHLRLGSIYFQLDDKAKALEHWKKAKELDPKNTSFDALIKKMEDTLNGPGESQEDEQPPETQDANEAILPNNPEGASNG